RRSFVFLFRATAISAIYSLSLHDALPILDGVETSARAAGLRCWLEGGGSRYLGNMEMLCPKCHNLMRRYERNGVIVDQCSECGGLFLDRGELEHLVDAETAFNQRAAAAPPPPPPPAYGRDPRYDDRYYDDRRYEDDRYHRRRRRRNFFDDLFDFD